MAIQENDKYLWKLLGIIGFVGAISVAVSGNIVGTLILMVLSYLSNVSYSVTSRSGTRNSALFHAIAVIASNVVFYSVLNRLITNDLSIALFVPYTVATVWGSFTGANFSKKVEEKFGITTSNEKPTTEEEKRRAKMAKRVLLSLLAVLTICLFIFGRELSFVLALTLIGAKFANEASFSLLRRARNASSITYHIVVILVQSATWFLLYKILADNKMSPVLFWPYCFGSVLGNLFGQEVSKRIEKMIGTSADAHLNPDLPWYKFIPWNSVALLGTLSLVLLLLTENPVAILGLLALAAGQQMSFTLVSRSRTRNNMTYHVIASIFSNGVWFLTFRQVNSVEWTPSSYAPYATGSAMGSVAGAGTSMAIENALGITSDSDKGKQKTVKAA